MYTPFNVELQSKGILYHYLRRPTLNAERQSLSVYDMLYVSGTMRSLCEPTTSHCDLSICEAVVYMH